MADLKISQLPLTQTLIPNDIVPIVSQASTKQTMLSSLSAFVATDLYQSDANLLALLNQADANLLTLINTLSTNMLKIGNYPYLEYAWVTAPNAAGQAITANTITTLTLNTEVADLGNFGSLTSNQITLAAGTYQFEAFVSVDQASFGGCGIFGLRRVGSTYITRTGSQGGASDNGDNAFMRGQFTFNTPQSIELTYLSPAAGTYIRNTKTNGWVLPHTNTTADADQRTTLKLWKVA